MESEDVHNAIEEYYKLKQEYETRSNITKIARNKALSAKEKRAAYIAQRPKCINCRRPGGTIFKTTYTPATNSEAAFRQLSAKCGIIADPCNLNIVIRLGNMEKLPDILSELEDEIRQIKSRIIATKNKLLFKLVDEKAALVEFEQHKLAVNEFSSMYEQYLNVYSKRMDEDGRRRELDRQLTIMYMLIAEIKAASAAHDVAVLYNQRLKPILAAIRALKYDVNEVDSKCNLVQNPTKLDKLLYASYTDTVEQFDVGYNPSFKAEPQPMLQLKPGTAATAAAIASAIAPAAVTAKLWNKLPAKLRIALDDDPEWKQEFMEACTAARTIGEPCEFISPPSLILPPKDGTEFGVPIYNEAFAGLSKDEQRTYLKLHAGADYRLLKDAMNTLVAKNVNFGKGYI